MIKRIIVALVFLPPFVGILGMASEEPGSVPAVPMFFSILIILIAETMRDKINKLNEKTDMILAKLSDAETKNEPSS